MSIVCRVSLLMVLKAVCSTGGPSSEYEELYVFFLLICERSAKRDMGHILLPNNRIGSRENVTLALQHMGVLCYNGWKV